MGTQHIDLTVNYAGSPLGNINDLDYVGKFITAAGITDLTQQTALNNLGASIDAFSGKSKIIALYPFAGSTADSHKFNLLNPVDTDDAHRLLYLNDLPAAHTSKGYVTTGASLSRYARIMGLASLVNLMDVHLGVYNSNPSQGASSDNEILAGVIMGSNAAAWVSRKYTSLTMGIAGQSASVNRISADVAYDRTKIGYIAINRTSTANAAVWDDGIKIASSSLQQTQVSYSDITEMLIGGSRPSGIASSPVQPSNTTISTTVLAGGLNDLQNLQLNNIIKTYNNAIGR